MLRAGIRQCNHGEDGDRFRIDAYICIVLLAIKPDGVEVNLR